MADAAGAASTAPGVGAPAGRLRRIIGYGAARAAVEALLGLRGVALAALLGPSALGLWSLLRVVAQYLVVAGLGVQRGLEVEAAAQQDKFEAMYKKMFETQQQWGDQQVPHDDLFRQFAVELGLDMTRWDTDYASDTTWARIKVDIDDGNALGVTGTPAFFVNGQRLQPKSFADVTAALDQALD